MTENQGNRLISLQESMLETMRSVQEQLKQQRQTSGQNGDGPKLSQPTTVTESLKQAINLASKASKVDYKAANGVVDFIEGFYSKVKKLEGSEAVSILQSTSDILTNINDLVSNKGMVSGLSNIQTSLTMMVASVVENVETIGELDQSNIDKTSQILNMISANVGLFTGRMKLSAPVLRTTPQLLTSVTESISNFVEEIGGMPQEDIDKISVISSLGKNLAGFGILMIPAAPGLLIGSAVLPLFGLALRPFIETMNRIGDSDKFKDAVKALPMMGLGLLAFSAGVAGSVALMGFVMSEPEKLLTLFGVLGAGALTFAAIGMADKQIRGGSVAVMAMSASLVVFTLAANYTAQTMADNYENLVTIPLYIGGLALTFGLVGKFSQQILMGSLALGVASGVMYLFGASLENMSGVMQDESLIWKVPAMIGAVGGAFALAGIPVVSAAILSGSLALGVASGALYIFGAALDKISQVSIDQSTADNIAYSISAVAQGFGRAFSELSVVEMAALPVTIPMVGLMGLSLMSLGTGISVYSSKAGSWTPADADNLRYTIQSLVGAFSIAGTPDGMSTLFGLPIGQNSVERGIESTMKIGSNLKNLTEGIMAWKDMNLSASDIQIISDNINRVLNTIPSVFATIGQRERGSIGDVSFLGITIPNPFEKGDIEAGIDSVSELGDTLSSLSEGILAWKSGGSKGISPQLIENVKSNILLLLSSLPSAFAEIGKADKDSSGIFPWSDGDIERGIELMSELSPTISSIADLLNSIKDQDTADLAMRVQRDIPKVVVGLGQAMIDFANLTDDYDIDDIADDVEDTVDVLSSVMKLIQASSSDTSDSLQSAITDLDTFVARIQDFKSGIGDLSSLTDPITALANAISTLNDSIADQNKVLLQMDLQRMEQLSAVMGAATNFASIEEEELRSNMAALASEGLLTQTQERAAGLDTLSDIDRFDLTQPQIVVERERAVERDAPAPQVNVTTPEQVQDNTEMIAALQQMNNMLQNMMAQLINSSNRQAEEIEMLRNTLINQGIKTRDGF